MHWRRILLFLGNESFPRILFIERLYNRFPEYSSSSFQLQICNIQVLRYIVSEGEGRGCPRINLLKESRFNGSIFDPHRHAGFHTCAIFAIMGINQLTQTSHIKNILHTLKTLTLCQ